VFLLLNQSLVSCVYGVLVSFLRVSTAPRTAAESLIISVIVCRVVGFRSGLVASKKRSWIADGATG